MKLFRPKLSQEPKAPKIPSEVTKLLELVASGHIHSLEKQTRYCQWAVSDYLFVFGEHTLVWTDSCLLVQTEVTPKLGGGIRCIRDEWGILTKPHTVYKFPTPLLGSSLRALHNVVSPYFGEERYEKYNHSGGERIVVKKPVAFLTKMKRIDGKVNLFSLEDGQADPCWISAAYLDKIVAILEAYDVSAVEITFAAKDSVRPTECFEFISDDIYIVCSAMFNQVAEKPLKEEDGRVKLSSADCGNIGRSVAKKVVVVTEDDDED